MAWRGSLSRSFMTSSRASLVRSGPAAPRFRPPPLAAPRPQTRRFSFANPRALGESGCVQTLLPLRYVMAAPRLTSHLGVAARACCELSHGTFCRTCQGGVEKMGDAQVLSFIKKLENDDKLYLNRLLDLQHSRCNNSLGQS